MSAREDILGRIGQALTDRPAVGRIPRDYDAAGSRHATTAELVALFSERVSEYQATVRRCRIEDVSGTVASALDAAGVLHVVAPAGFPAGWCTTAVRDEPALSTRLLDELDGVITLCSLGIAQTGTLVMNHAADGQGRRLLSLLPDYHLVLIRACQIVETVPDAVTALDPTAPMTWISGPSATSDIELSRVEGVHGPRRLEVIVVND